MIKAMMKKENQWSSQKTGHGKTSSFHNSHTMNVFDGFTMIMT